MDENDIDWFDPPSSEKCVSCGQIIERGERGFPDHHCSPRYEATLEALNRLAEDDLLPDEILYRVRLALEFSMLND